MRLTVVGCGDAFGGAGRGNACFRLEAGGRVIALDFGATALAAWRKLGFDPCEIDAIVLSHLHGDHFAGVPFLLLCLEFEKRSGKPLLVVGPPGTRAAISKAVEILYPGLAARVWRFEWRVEEVEAGGIVDVCGLKLTTFAMDHGEHVRCLGLRVTDGRRAIAYSGDTAWTDELVALARGADMLVIECFSEAREVPGHLDWPRLRANISRIEAQRVVVTHMSAAMRARSDELVAAGLTPLDDGLVLEV